MGIRREGHVADLGRGGGPPAVLEKKEKQKAVSGGQRPEGKEQTANRESRHFDERVHSL